MNNFVWDESTWNEYVLSESLYKDALPGETNGDYVGAIRLDEFIPVTSENKVVKLHRHFTQVTSSISI